MFCEVIHCVGCILANTRPNQLCWGDWKMEIATCIHILCTERSQVSGFIQS